MAKRNIRKGPTIQVIRKEMTKSLGFWKSNGSLEKSTLVSGGYIIRINPIAKGILVVPEDKLLNVLGMEGRQYPNPTPIIIARNIHSVR